VTERETIRRLERAAFRAWPAEETAAQSGWQLRFMRGVSKRGNSVYTSEGEAGAPLEQRLDAVERRYRERGLSPRFHLSPVSGPPELDEALAARGYEIDTPVSVQVADVETLLDPDDDGALVSSELEERWFALAGAKSRFAQHQETYRGLLARLGPRAAYALATLDGQPAATALGVHDGEWLGIHSMLTQPDFRRRGLGMALIKGLVSHARERRAEKLYLLVELDNTSALRLYERAGFCELYRTHYRTLR
jgi:ribosomal protein S18 acetylase RimI-like enzyme